MKRAIAVHFVEVNIKSKVWHFQVSLALGLPTALFIYLLQTRFVWLVLVSATMVFLAVLSIELFLRKITKRAPIFESRIKEGPIEIQDSYDQARLDTGLYPYDYLTPAVWKEIQSLRINQNLYSGTTDIYKIACQSSVHEFYKTFNYIGEHYVVSGGLRNTTDFTDLTRINNVFVFGGSTVFCMECPDPLTVTSFLQRMINSVSNGIEVVNCGWSGASAIDRVQMLTDSVEVKKNDVVIFLIGDNDSGLHYTDKLWKRYLPRNSLPVPIQILKILKTHFGLETAKWLYDKVAPRGMRKFADQKVNKTTTALVECEKFCRMKGVSMVSILQPNLYTLRTKYLSEIRVEQSFSHNLGTLLLYAYQYYVEWVKQTPFAVSATHIFDSAAAPVFLDWSHVNARGNEIIANFIFEELQRREVISSVSTL